MPQVPPSNIVASHKRDLNVLIDDPAVTAFHCVGTGVAQALGIVIGFLVIRTFPS